LEWLRTGSPGMLLRYMGSGKVFWGGVRGALLLIESIRVTNNYFLQKRNMIQKCWKMFFYCRAHEPVSKWNESCSSNSDTCCWVSPDKCPARPYAYLPCFKYAVPFINGVKRFNLYYTLRSCTYICLHIIWRLVSRGRYLTNIGIYPLNFHLHVGIIIKRNKIFSIKIHKMKRLSPWIIFRACNGRYKPVLCVSESENGNLTVI